MREWLRDWFAAMGQALHPDEDLADDAVLDDVFVLAWRDFNARFPEATEADFRETARAITLQ
jgi:hypothetical protein